MYQQISHSLYFLLSPLSWIFFFLILALLWASRRRLFLLLALGFCTFFGNVWLQGRVIAWWEVRGLAYADVSQYSHCVVLGGFMEVDEVQGQFDWNGSVDRITVPLMLLMEGRTQRLIVSGGRHPSGIPKKSNPWRLKKQLEQLGLDTSALVAESEARNTYENALKVRELLAAKGWEKDTFLLVTSARHMRRAAACFSAQDLHFVAVPVDHWQDAGPRPLRDYFLPGSQTLFRWNSLLKEMIGYQVYGWLGYL